jgi:deoxyribonuclease V
MILAFDSYYFGNKAKTVCIVFHNWTDRECYQIHSETIESNEEYKPGEFYKRELPCILSLLDKIKIEKVESIIIDGFVYLDDNGRLGLGGHLYRQLESKISIIGVAKSNFATLEKNKRHVLRGKSLRPLYITSIGMDLDEATKLVESMSGPNRIPTLLKRLDTLTKEKTLGND